jgi:hypothetical protein
MPFLRSFEYSDLCAILVSPLFLGESAVPSAAKTMGFRGCPQVALSPTLGETSYLGENSSCQRKTHLIFGNQIYRSVDILGTTIDDTREQSLVDKLRRQISIDLYSSTKIQPE